MIIYDESVRPRCQSDPCDLETLLREGQDRLRGRPQTWWERNNWRVYRWFSIAGLAAGAVIYLIWAVSFVYVASHFIRKFW